MQKSTNILDILSEKVHYDIVPAEEENLWNVRILEEFPETIISYGAIEFVGEDKNDKDGKLSFNFQIISSPDPDLSVNDLTLQEYSGRILESILDTAVSDGTLIARDNNTDEVLMSEHVRKELEQE
tara:strand:- start:42 stop:419 length:378 start_codon:yes stop_codon:yes gene_type:complete